MNEDLDKPLGQKKAKNSAQTDKKARPNLARRGWRSLVQFRKGPLPLTRILLALFFAIIALILGTIYFVEDEDGGRPSAMVKIAERQLEEQNITQPPSPKIDEEKPKPEQNSEQNIQIGNNNVTIIKVGDDIPDSDSENVEVSSTSIKALNDFGVLPNLIEETPNGPIPIIGQDGTTPFAAYKRPSISLQNAGDKKLIAIIITGIGLSESGTLNAIEKLPGAISLAFAPYGRTLKATSAAARNDGHEILLSIPMEPFDYPDNDPGPQTLLTDQPIRANLDRLFWLMARVGGYVGVINHTGAKFTASAKDFTPIMEEFALRGLAYIDDGTSNRSLAANLAMNNKVPFARVQVQIDRNLSKKGILTQLAELERLSNEQGYAIGVASAFPVSIETIAKWSKSLEEKNIVLVPISALVRRP